VEANNFWENKDPTFTTEKPEEVDRRSLFRILKQLQMDQLINIWRIIITNEKVRKAAAAFTPFPVIVGEFNMI